MTKETYENIWKFLKGNPGIEVSVTEFAVTNRKVLFDQGSHARPKFHLGIDSSNVEVLYKVVRGQNKVVLYKEQAEDRIKDMHRPNGSACTAMGARKLEKTFSATYFVNDVRRLVQETLDKCTGRCKVMKTLSVSAPPPKPVHTSYIMERVQMDLLQIYGPKSPFSSESGHNYRLILSVMDCFSKYCWLVPLQTKQTVEVANGLCAIFKQFGCPHILHSDNGGEFVSNVTQILCSQLNIKVIHGRPYHPQSQGQVENLNKRVKRALVLMFLKFKKDDQAKIWPSILCEVAQLLNNTFNNAIKDIPFRVFFGRDSGHFGLNNTFGLWPSDEELLHQGELHTTKRQQPENTDEAVVDILDDNDFDMCVDCDPSEIREYKTEECLSSVCTADIFLELCRARDEVQRRTVENLEHNALKNHVAYINKAGKGRHFTAGQDVLFPNPQQQGLVKILNTKGRIVDALSGDYYHVSFATNDECDSTSVEPHQSIALHASSLTAYLTKETPEHMDEPAGKCRDINITDQIARMADIQRLKFYKLKRNQTGVRKDVNAVKVLNNAFSFLHQTDTTMFDNSQNSLMELFVYHLDLLLLADITDNKEIQTNLLQFCYYLSGVHAWETSRHRNHIHLEYAYKNAVIPVFISSNHSCVDCLKSGPCTHLCCYKWYINLGIKSGLVERSGENLKLKVDAAFKHTEPCTLSTVCVRGSITSIWEQEKASCV